MPAHAMDEWPDGNDRRPSRTESSFLSVYGPVRDRWACENCENAPCTSLELLIPFTAVEEVGPKTSCKNHGLHFRVRVCTRLADSTCLPYS